MEMKWRTAEVEARAQGLGGRGKCRQFNLAGQEGSRRTSDCKDLLGLYCGIPLFQKISVALGRGVTRSEIMFYIFDEVPQKSSTVQGSAFDPP